MRFELGRIVAGEMRVNQEGTLGDIDLFSKLDWWRPMKVVQGTHIFTGVFNVEVVHA